MPLRSRNGSHRIDVCMPCIKNQKLHSTMHVGCGRVNTFTCQTLARAMPWLLGTQDAIWCWTKLIKNPWAQAHTMTQTTRMNVLHVDWTSTHVQAYLTWSNKESNMDCFVLSNCVGMRPNNKWIYVIETIAIMALKTNMQVSAFNDLIALDRCLACHCFQTQTSHQTKLACCGRANIYMSDNCPSHAPQTYRVGTQTLTIGNTWRNMMQELLE